MTVVNRPTAPATPAGWYPDPHDAGRWRYWDGSAWTEDRAPRGGATPPRPPSGPARRFPPVVIAIVAAAVLAIAVVAWRTSGSGSDNPTPGPSVTVQDDGGGGGAGGDAAVKAGVDVIARGCREFAGANGYGPSVDDVAPDGAVAQFVPEWPTNPFTGEPMQQGQSPGDFTFHTAAKMPDGEYFGYVDGHLADGTTYSAEYDY